MFCVYFCYSDISKSTSEGTSDLISKSTKLSYLKSQKLKNTNPIVLERLHHNPLELANKDLFSDNVPFEESKLSAYSSSDVNDNSLTSSEENSNDNLSEKDKACSSESDSDSFIQFENDDLSFSNPESTQFIKKNRDDNSESCVESTHQNINSDKFKENMHFKNSSSSAQKSRLHSEIELSSESLISFCHPVCYKRLENVNHSLVYSLGLFEFYKFASFIFRNETLPNTVVDMSDWKNVKSSFTIEELDFYQKWLICILCTVQSVKNFTCHVVKANLCLILSDINDQLNEMKSSVTAKSTQSVKTHTAQFSCDNGKGKNQLPASSKKQKDTKASINFSKETHVRDFARGYLYIQVYILLK